MSNWIEPADRTRVAEYWLTRRDIDAEPGYGHGEGQPDIRERFRWNGRDAWFDLKPRGRHDHYNGVCLHSANGWRIAND